MLDDGVWSDFLLKYMIYKCLHLSVFNFCNWPYAYKVLKKQKQIQATTLFWAHIVKWQNCSILDDVNKDRALCYCSSLHVAVKNITHGIKKG